MIDSIRMISLKLTYRCNLNCYMCGQRKFPRERLEREMDFDRIKRLIDQCGDLRYGVYLWGGEPLIYSRIKELLDFLYDRRIFTTINTNGVNLDRYAEQIAGYPGYSKLIFSVDGAGELHDKIRGVRGAYGRLKENIKRLNALRGKNLILLSNTVVTSENYTNLYETMCEISALGADRMECQLPMFFTDECGERYERRMSRELGVRAGSWRGFRGEYGKLEVDVLAGELQKIYDKFGRKFRLIPNLDHEGLARYFSEPDRNLNGQRCRLPTKQLTIEPDGSVVVCPDFPDYTIGNIYRQEAEEIWNGEALAKFRGCLERERLPICSRCCSLYQF